MRQTALQQARNAFEILSRLPKHGLGSKLSRTSWTDDCYWTVQKVKVSPDGKHGTAWGVLTWRGQAAQPDTPTQIAGPLKPVWRLVADGSSSGQAEWTSQLAAKLRQEKQAAAAAAAQAAEAAEPAVAATEQTAAA